MKSKPPKTDQTAGAPEARIAAGSAADPNRSRTFNFRPWGEDPREFTFMDLDLSGPTIRALDEHGRNVSLRLTLPDAQWSDSRGPLASVNSRPILLKKCALHLPVGCANEAESQAFEDSTSDRYIVAARFGPVTALGMKCWEDCWSDDDLEGFRQLVDVRFPWQRLTAEALLNDVCPNRRPPWNLKVLRHHEDWTSGARDILCTARDAELHRRWAKQHGIDLDAIPAEAERFQLWLAGAATSAAARVRFAKTQGTPALERVHVNDISPEGWDILRARVRYRLDFLNGRSVWLNHVEIDSAPVPTAPATSDAPSPPVPAQSARARARRARGGRTQAWHIRAGVTPEFELMLLIMIAAHRQHQSDHQDRATHWGAKKHAIRAGRTWWMSNVTDPDKKAILPNVSNTTLYRELDRALEKHTRT